MLEIFRSNHFINTLLLIPYAIFLRAIPMYFGDFESISTQGIWTMWVFGPIIIPSIFNQILAIVFVFFQAAMINRLCIKNRVTNELTLFPGLFYILFTSFFPGITLLSSALIANTFILIGLGELFSAHRKARTAEIIFSVGFWFSCAVVTFNGYFLMLLFPILGLSTLRTIKWINVVQLLIGILTPFIIIAMLSIILNKSILPTVLPLTEPLGIYVFDFEKNWLNIAQFIFFPVWIVVAILQYNGFTLKRNIHSQKKVSLFFWLLAFVLVCVVFRQNFSEQMWVMFAIPLGILASMTFIRIRTKIVAELLHFFLLICLFAIQILIFF